MDEDLLPLLCCIYCILLENLEKASEYFFCHSVFFSFLFPFSHKTRPFRIVCVREFLFSLQSFHNNTISLFAYENVRTHWFALKGSHKQNHRPDSKKEYSIRLMFYKIVSLANSILGFGSADFFPSALSFLLLCANHTRVSLCKQINSCLRAVNTKIVTL